MPKRRLTSPKKEEINSLIEATRKKLLELSLGDSSVLFAMRRRLYVQLSYDERGKPAHRARLKKQKWKDQLGKCTLCNEDLPSSEAELDRIDAYAGYTSENTQLIHHDCHRKQQAERGFA